MFYWCHSWYWSWWYDPNISKRAGYTIGNIVIFIADNTFIYNNVLSGATIGNVSVYVFTIPINLTKKNLTPIVTTTPSINPTGTADAIVNQIISFELTASNELDIPFMPADCSTYSVSKNTGINVDKSQAVLVVVPTIINSQYTDKNDLSLDHFSYVRAEGYYYDYIHLTLRLMLLILCAGL